MSRAARQPAFYGEDLAWIHDAGFSELARSAAPWIMKRIRSKGHEEGVVVELGCGSGHLLRAILDSGFDAVGIDQSSALLALARGNAPGASLQASPILDAKLPVCVAVVAVGEVLSYVKPDERSRPPSRDLFSRVGVALRPGGLLLFDVPVRTMRRKRYRSWREGDGWAVLIDVRPDETGRCLQREIVTFRKREGSYRRGFERHAVYLFDEGEILEELDDVGFEARSLRGYGRARPGPGRIVIQASKR